MIANNSIEQPLLWRAFAPPPGELSGALLRTDLSASGDGSERFTDGSAGGQYILGLSDFTTIFRRFGLGDSWGLICS